MKFGIIGCGSIAENSFGPSRLRKPTSSLSAVATLRLPRHSRRDSMVRAYSSAAELVRDDRVEAVIVDADRSLRLHLLGGGARKARTVREADGEKRRRVSRNDRRVPGSRREPIAAAPVRKWSRPSG